MYNKLLMHLNMLIGTVFRSLRQKFFVVSNRVTRFPFNVTRAAAQKVSSFTFKKETSIKDYVRIGGYYVSKRYLLIATLLLFAGIYLLFIMLQKFGIIYYTGYPDQTANKTGKIKVYDKDTKNLIYRGGIENGLYSKFGEEFFNIEKEHPKYRGDFKDGLYDGYGVIFSQEGKPIYEGSFIAGNYNGNGKEYSINGNLKYEGAFKDGLYEGSGTLYDFDGKRLYNGNFSLSNYDGLGTEYNKAGNIVAEGNYFVGHLNDTGKTFYDSGVLKYTGGFKNGFYDGEGELYYENNTLTYKGAFKDNLYEGEGALYNKNGIKIYQGTFAKGLYNGEGVAYTDGGLPLFSGNFVDGKISEGKKFDESGKVTMEVATDDSGQIIKVFSDKGSDIVKYEGGFSDNTYNGEGKLYYEDPANTVKYEGTFKDGTYNGVGTLYDISKAVIYKGYFKNGSPDPQEFMGKSDNDLLAILGKPDDTPEYRGNIVFLYPAFNLKFTLNKDNSLNVMKVVSTSISSVIDVYGVNKNMNEGSLRSVIGAPYKTVFTKELTLPESPMPIAPPKDAAEPSDNRNSDLPKEVTNTEDSSIPANTSDTDDDSQSDNDDESSKENKSDDNNGIRKFMDFVDDLFSSHSESVPTFSYILSGPGGKDSNSGGDNHGGSGPVSGSGNYKKLYYEESGYTFKIIINTDTGEIVTLNIEDRNYEK